MKNTTPKTTAQIRARLEALEELESKHLGIVEREPYIDERLIAAIHTLRWALGKQNYLEHWAWLADQQGGLDELLASAMVMSIVPADGRKVDLRFLLQLGAAMYYDKPLILVAVKGAKLPPRMYAFADEVVQIDGLADAASKDALQAAIQRVMKKRLGVDLDQQ
jgi:hypothetical protein